MAKNLPSVTSPLPRDLQQFVQRVRESLDGGGLDAAVTTRQLISSGLLSGTAGVALVPYNQQELLQTLQQRVRLQVYWLAGTPRAITVMLILKYGRIVPIQ